MNERASYLYEREFYPVSGTHDPDPEKQEFWRKNLGEDFFHIYTRVFQRFRLTWRTEIMI